MSHHRYANTPRCPVSKKVIHVSYCKALHHMKQLGKKHPEGIANLTVYDCKHCLGWHVGHVKKEK